jgi:hypothetical protein
MQTKISSYTLFMLAREVCNQRVLHKLIYQYGIVYIDNIFFPKKQTHLYLRWK